VTNKLPDLPLPVLRFSQPLDRFNVHLDSRVYSTPQALLGFFLQSHTLRRSTTVLRSKYFFAVIYLLRFPSILGKHSRTPLPQRISLNYDITTIWPLVLFRTGFHFRFRPTLKFFSRLNALPFAPQFHPKNAAKTLMAFSSSGPFWLPWFPSPL